MSTELHLRKLLQADAERYRPSVSPERAIADRLARRQRQRRRRRIVGMALPVATAVALGATSIWWWPRGTNHGTTVVVSPPPSRVAPQATPCAGQPAGCGTPPGSASALAHGTWTSLTPGPLSARSGQVAAWTGHEFVVWGGAVSTDRGTMGPALGDGAAYDPTERTWTTLPPAPIPPRWDAAGVWDGSAFFVWGGQSSSSGLDTDGATYDPERRTWSPLPRAPLSARAGATALWTGSQVVVLGGADINRRELDDGAAYTPSTGTWSTLPPLPGPPPQPAGTTMQLESIGATWTGRQVVLVATYESHSSCGPTCRAIGAYSVFATWAPGASSWTTLSSAPRSVSTFESMLTWTGSRVLVLAVNSCFPEMSCPAPFGGTLGALDPTSGAWTVGPNPRTTRGLGVWTGRSLVVLGQGTGEVYDPTSAVWSALPPQTSLVPDWANGAWTGAGLLVWTGAAAGHRPSFWLYTPT